MSDRAPRFQEPGWFTKHVFNRIVAGLARLGVSIAGSRVLEVQGRKSGEWRQTPVNPLEFEGNRYLVSPRGNTQWGRDMRVSGGGGPLRGRKGEEVTPAQSPEGGRPPPLRRSLGEGEWEGAALFRGRR